MVRTATAFVQSVYRVTCTQASFYDGALQCQSCEFVSWLVARSPLVQITCCHLIKLHGSASHRLPRLLNNVSIFFFVQCCLALFPGTSCAVHFFCTLYRRTFVQCRLA
ncbi:hypothetical protein TRVL_09024 [Trypanosoma vivax]|nr:hypothetical protein TRVL_09024 [Trypanosoma vivax]